MKNQVICDRCGAADKHWDNMPKGWRVIEGGDLCPKCVKRYNKSWKNKIKKVKGKYSVEINKKCKDRDEAGDIMFKTFLNT